MPVLFDTLVFLYVRGRDHPYREPCRRLVEKIRAGEVVAAASVELIQEFAHVLLRRGIPRHQVAAEATGVAALCSLHSFEPEDAELALSLIESSQAVQMRDAVHAATALRRGIGIVVSADRSFDEVAGLERLDPVDAAARLGL